MLRNVTYVTWNRPRSRSYNLIQKCKTFSNPQNLKVPIEIVSQDLSLLHELSYQNKVINLIEFAQSFLSLFFLAQENYNPLSKYTIALASCGVTHCNGSLDLFFLLLNLCSLQKIMYSFWCIFIWCIYSHNSEVLSEVLLKQRQLWFKGNIYFFLKFIQKLAHYVLSFSL